MGKIAIITDCNSGITQKMGEELGVHVIPMPFYINGEEFFEDITLTKEEFYQRIVDEDVEISTSMPSPGEVVALWEELLKQHDEIVYIPMSSGLSSSCATATSMAEDYDDRVQVVNNQRISVILEQSVLDAIALREEGKSAREIKEALEREKLEASIYITVDTLKYLKKGGRVTAAGAAIGTVLNVKPVLTIQGDKLDSFAKVRGWKMAKRTMLEAMKQDIEERFVKYEGQMTMQIAYTCEEAEAKEWQQEVSSYFPQFDVIARPLSLSVACHIGPGAMAIACAKRVG